MATAFQPRTSFRGSANRPPPNANTSAADDLPSIDFGFDDLRHQMTSFTTRFDEYIGSGRKTVLSSRNGHRAQLAELQENAALKQRQIAILESSATTHASTLQKEAQELAEMQAAIAALTGSKDEHASRNAALGAQIASSRAAIEARLAAQREYAERVSAQASLNAPELAFYEEYLGLRIESPADDEIAFVFCCVDDRDPEREFEVVLDLSRRDYEVKKTRPRLERGELQGIVERLNEGRDLAPFLKEVRTLFRKKSRE